MKVEQVNKILQDKNMQNKNCNFKLTGTDGQKVTIRDVLVEMRKGFAQINTRIDGLETRIDGLETRIDNLIIKNKLVE